MLVEHINVNVMNCVNRLNTVTLLQMKFELSVQTMFRTTLYNILSKFTAGSVYSLIHNISHNT